MKTSISAKPTFIINWKEYYAMLQEKFTTLGENEDFNRDKKKAFLKKIVTKEKSGANPTILPSG